MAAAENFKRPETTAGVGDLPNTVPQPIQEESEEEDEVGTNFTRVLGFHLTREQGFCC